ncbi:hypothetical protein SAMN05720781_0769 [Fibrobacter sp. UWT3]|uniref:DUF5683 domain-containing protein n=1 Tax=Fibrobacter sp. UWT3 TaxID=1896225 RepID=UPI000BC922EB|nr:DUF5683 domain-containing protein [Fibrobacter sp. UWT3]SOE54504.1 hypothetical protein SAMN05720781_0769 [Fibrobacter sp. UWT3]
MHKFHLVACFAGLLAVQSFAQPRDLFAEFEAEAEAAQSSETVVSSSSAAVSSSSVAPASSAALSSSSVAPSSSSVASSSSVVASSSSVAPADTAAPAVADTAAPAVADTTAPADTTVADSAAGDSAIADSAKPMTPEEAYAAEMRRLSEENRIRDSLAALSSSSSEQPAPDISSSSMSRRDLLGPVKVSKVYGIDDMKGRYKSPRKALFMSLVVPGSGQLYVGGSTFTYVRGGAYLALEAALWGSWAYFSVYKYNDQVKKYKKFAREHYSIGRYEAGMRELVGQLSDETEESRFETRYMNSRESFCEAIYGNASSAGCYTANRLFYNDKSHYDRFSVGNPTSLENEIESVGSFYDGSAVYQQIADRAYVLGWDDVEEPAVAMNLELEDDEPSDGIVPLAKSSNMDEYRSMRSKANDYADLQVWFFGGLILNHIVSAIDAAFTANAHNKTLYSEELSWYDRLHFDSYVSIFNGLDVGVQASWGF